MNKELMKSVFLFFLVGLSIFLTWNIWTYSPDIKPIDDEEYIQDEIAVNEKQVTKNVIKPHQVMYHIKGSQYGSYSDEEIASVLNEMAGWTFYDYKNATNRLGGDNFNTFLHQDGMVVLLFSDDVPFALYRQMIQIEEKEIPEENIGFDRILIDIGEKDENEKKVYFASTGSRHIHEFKANGDSIADFVDSIGSYAGELPGYDVTEVAEDRYIYLPSEEAVINQYKYLPEMLDKNDFSDALFPDQASVKRETVAGGEEFTDGSSIMKVMNETMTLQYVDPSKTKGNPVSAHTEAEILEKSIDFVNEHAGWNDNYRFVQLTGNSQKSTVRYRLYVQGLPVFNEQGMAEVIQDWEKQELTRYARPFFKLNKYLPQETSPVTLYSGQEALAAIKAMEGFDPDYLQGMTIGYSLNKLDSRIVSLMPAWFYKYKDEWLPLIPAETGRAANGLE